MAAAQAMTNHHIVSLTLHHLSSLMYRDRRQHGPDQPVEFLEFRPTLVPSILVNKLWADAGTSILWARYPHLPVFATMSKDRRQWYASKVERVFSLGPSEEFSDDLSYLDGLEWPLLKSLELEVDWMRHGSKFEGLLHAHLDHLEISGFQSGGSKYFTEDVLAMLFSRCQNLKSLRIGPDTIDPEDPVHVSALFSHLDSRPSLNSLHVKSTNFIDKDALFARLSQRPGLEALEIDLDPGMEMLPFLSGPNALQTMFTSLKRLQIMCYPEIALALPTHLSRVEELQFDLARLPSSASNDADVDVLPNLFAQLSHCPRLRLLKIGIAQLAIDFPSVSALPRLPGDALVSLAQNCPELEDINVFAADPATIDGSEISSDQFDRFCRTLPHLRNLSLKLHNTKGSGLDTTALQSLGTHCPELEIVRLKIPYQLPGLPVSSEIPQLFVHGESTHDATTPLSQDLDSALDSLNISDSAAPSPHSHKPLFPKLTHLAIARPETHLSLAADAFTVSTVSPSSTPSLIISPELEEALVRSWAHPLLTHFPSLEILEAWGDCGADNSNSESLNYFLPMEEILASTWEFLSGVEQDLWDDGDDDGYDMEVEDEAWAKNFDEDGTHRSRSASFASAGDDWDKASLMNEFSPEHESESEPVHVDTTYLGMHEEEPPGMITPGRTLSKEELEDGFFPHYEVQLGSSSPVVAIASPRLRDAE